MSELNFTTFNLDVFDTSKVQTSANKKAQAVVHDFPAIVVGKYNWEDPKPKTKRRFSINLEALRLLGFSFTEDSLDTGQFISFQFHREHNAIYCYRYRQGYLVNKAMTFSSKPLFDQLVNEIPYVRENVANKDVVFKVEKVEQDQLPVVLCKISVYDYEYALDTTSEEVVDMEEEYADANQDSYDSYIEETELV